MASSKRPPAPQPANVNFRSAKTGHYVTERFAKQHPTTTVREIDKPKFGK